MLSNLARINYRGLFLSRFSRWLFVGHIDVLSQQTATNELSKYY
jgi:hypothetical protein